MLKRLAPLAIDGTVGFLLVSLLNGVTLASTVSTTSDQVSISNLSFFVEATQIYPELLYSLSLLRFEQNFPSVT